MRLFIGLPRIFLTIRLWVGYSTRVRIRVILFGSNIFRVTALSLTKIGLNAVLALI